MEEGRTHVSTVYHPVRSEKSLFILLLTQKHSMIKTFVCVKIKKERIVNNRFVDQLVLKSDQCFTLEINFLKNTMF